MAFGTQKSKFYANFVRLMLTVSLDSYSLPTRFLHTPVRIARSSLQWFFSALSLVRSGMEVVPSGLVTLGVILFVRPMPTGVTVGQDRHIFVNFPCWGDPVPFTVAEIKGSQLIAGQESSLRRLGV